MSQLLQCPCCRGAKKIMGLGMMQKECGNCTGIGWVTVPLKAETPKEVATLKENSSTELQLPLKPKRGRRAKQLDLQA